VTEGVDEGWGEVVSRIVLRPELADGLRGIEEFSHAVIIFLMHRHTFDPAADLTRRPRGRDDMPLLGAFAQRAKHRPNPIGITPVAILSVDGPILTVRGLDAIDGTPVLDIKPYVPAFDRVESAHVPAWIERLMEGYF
jgi:tRNA-Thr(GGU) m(6)t(6)A37 methyltransferase TsaA